MLIQLASIVSKGDLSVLPKMQDAVLITEPSAAKLYGELVCQALQPKEMLLIPSGEAGKTFDVANYCLERMYALGLTRASSVIALGGGSVTDLAGFVGAVYMRGIDTIYIPTTLMGMVDAAIGGKTAVNLPGAKNIIGAFHMPKKVHIFLDFLKTLPGRERSSGMAEVIKYGVIADPELFNHLEGDVIDLEWIIDRAIAIKMEIVERDPFDQGIRAHLNYGHTFAHALEALTGYKRYLHGEAVAIGMQQAALVALSLGFVDEAFLERQKRVIQKFGLPVDLPLDVPLDQLIRVMKQDKKSMNGKISLIVPKEIGRVVKYTDIDTEVLKKAVA